MFIIDLRYLDQAADRIYDDLGDRHGVHVDLEFERGCLVKDAAAISQRLVCTASLPLDGSTLDLLAEYTEDLEAIAEVDAAIEANDVEAHRLRVLLDPWLDYVSQAAYVFGYEFEPLPDLR